MNENNITRFEVSNFKKFDHLVVENIGQVNLITGDNNVGKTTLLEALLFSENNVKWISDLHTTLDWKRIHIHIRNEDSTNPKFPKENFLKYLFTSLKKNLEVKYSLSFGGDKMLSMASKTIDEISDAEWRYRKDKYKMGNARNWIIFYKNNIIDEVQWLHYDEKMERGNEYIPFISFNLSYNYDLHDYIESFKQKATELNYDEKAKIISFLRIFIDDIVDYSINKFGTENIIAIATESNRNYRPFTQLGDGIQKFFRYAVEILYAKKKGEYRIMIDEIDIGVHYLKMKDEWKAIFELSKQTGVQIFATTHSMDCIAAFVEAGNEYEEMKKDLRLIQLEEFTTKDGTNKHLATALTHSQLSAYLDSELNVRGGKLW